MSLACVSSKSWLEILPKGSAKNSHVLPWACKGKAVPLKWTVVVRLFALYVHVSNNISSSMFFAKVIITFYNQRKVCFICAIIQNYIAVRKVILWNKEINLPLPNFCASSKVGRGLIIFARNHHHNLHSLPCIGNGGLLACYFMSNVQSVSVRNMYAGLNFSFETPSSLCG